MLGHHPLEETAPAPLATTEELAEAVALLRHQKEEEERRRAESEALVAALAELGHTVTREELLDAVALVRARRAARAQRPQERWRRPALFAAATAVVLMLPILAVTLFAVPAPVAPPPTEPITIISGVAPMGDVAVIGPRGEIVVPHTGIPPSKP